MAVDPLRVVIDARSGGISGHEARRLLFDEHAIHTEMATDSAIVAVIGAGAVPDVDRVLAALDALPDTGAAASPPLALPDPGTQVVSLRDAYFAPAELVPAEQAVGRVSADALAAYPPGIPNVLPGELITADARDFLLQGTAPSLPVRPRPRRRRPGSDAHARSRRRSLSRTSELHAAWPRRRKRSILRLDLVSAKAAGSMMLERRR